jgi:branched-chain amino acid transport system substrate-binding protein
VAAESFEKDTRDFRSQIAKIRAASPTHIYLVGYGAQTGPATRQIREAGVQAAIIGTVAMEDAGYLALAGPASEGVVYPFARAPQGEAVEKFKDAFRARYAREPELLHDCGFDAANLFIEAFRGGARSAAEVRAFLANLRGFPGASGEISFDANGDVSKPMEMRVIRDGEFVPLTGSEGESGAVPG